MLTPTLKLKENFERYKEDLENFINFTKIFGYKAHKH